MLTLAVPPSDAIMGGAVAVSPHLPAESGAGVSDEEDSVQAPIRVAATNANATVIDRQRDGCMVAVGAEQEIFHRDRSQRRRELTSARMAACAERLKCILRIAKNFPLYGIILAAA